jgi:hypothetical protein
MPVQTIQTGNNYFLCSASAIADSTDMKIESLSKLAVYKDENVEFSDIISGPQDAIGLNQRFFYKIDKYEMYRGKKTLVSGETGIGEIYKKRKNFFMKRHFALYNYDQNSYSKPRNGSPYRFSLADDYIILQTYKPENYFDALAAPYSVLCSVEERTPSPVELQEGTLLGRLDDVIQSIDSKELRQILNGDSDIYLKLTDQEIQHVFKNIKNVIFETLRNNSDGITTKSKIIDMLTPNSSVESPILRAKPEYTNKKRPTKPKPGMIIFNRDRKCFEGYDGESWKTLSME